MNGDVVTVGASRRALIMALRGNALAAFPEAAYEERAVIHRLLGHRQFIFNSPSAIRRILIDNAANYRRTAPTIRVLRPLFGRGLFLSEGTEWKEQRRLVAGTFAPRAVRILAGHVAATTQSLVAGLRASAGPPIDLVPKLQRLALDIIGSAMFSLEMERHGALLRRLILRYGNRLGQPSLLDFLLPLAMPTPRDLARRRFRREWRAFLDVMTTERRHRTIPAVSHDLFDLLSAEAQRRAAPGVNHLADQVATILVAGHETTAAAIFWSLYLIASAPDEQERIAAEAASLDLSPPGAGEAVAQLTRTRAVVDEVLRLYPPAFVIVRQARAADVVDQVAVPSGSLVLVSPWILHRHRRLWSAPEAFNPGRFMPDAPPPDRFAYMPFGAGPRVCVGAQFALTELVLVVASLIRAFRIELAEPCLVRPTAIVTTQPENRPLFLLHPRTGGEAGAAGRLGRPVEAA